MRAPGGPCAQIMLLAAARSTFAEESKVTGRAQGGLWEGSVFKTTGFIAFFVTRKGTEDERRGFAVTSTREGKESEAIDCIAIK